jgi:hypothetical protein
LKISGQVIVCFFFSLLVCLSQQFFFKCLPDYDTWVTPVVMLGPKWKDKDPGN